MKQSSKSTVSKWRPIDSAPKDESAVLVYQPFKHVTMVTAAYWHRAYGEWRLAFTGLDKPPTVIEPTHWQPMPRPPK